jgi:potassium efflux system protein
MRSTTLVNADNMDIVVPNSNFIQNVVTNSTMRDTLLRIHAPFTLAHGIDIDEAISRLLSAFEASSLPYIKNNNDKKPTVIVTTLVDKGAECELLFFVDITYSSAQAKSDALKIIYETLGKELTK